MRPIPIRWRRRCSATPRRAIVYDVAPLLQLARGRAGRPVRMAAAVRRHHRARNARQRSRRGRAEPASDQLQLLRRLRPRDPEEDPGGAGPGGRQGRWSIRAGSAAAGPIFNNKGKPVRQYEPFFSQLAERAPIEFGVQVGVSPILCYDPVDAWSPRSIPNHTYEKVVFDPWQPGDLGRERHGPAGRSDRRSRRGRLSSSFCRRGLFAYLVRAARRRRLRDPSRTPPPKRPRTRTRRRVAYFDTLGRTFLTIADNGRGRKISHARRARHPEQPALDHRSRSAAIVDDLRLQHAGNGSIKPAWKRASAGC